MTELLTLEQVEARFLEMAPGEQDDAATMAQFFAVGAQRAFTRSVAPGGTDLDSEEFMWTFTILHLLMTLKKVDGQLADETALLIREALRNGLGAGRILGGHCHALGVDTDEVSSLEARYTELLRETSDAS
jgi:hypothetical protein